MVAKYGKQDELIERLCRNYQNIPAKALAEAAERRLAAKLRKRGYGVWWGWSNRSTRPSTDPDRFSAGPLHGACKDDMRIARSRLR